MVKSANFAECGARYMNDPALIARWNYSGPLKIIPANRTSQITYEGCVALCGTGNDWYPWATSSQFITTWVLPIIGTLLQAPFESNAFWRTVKAICRWIGSPMSSLAYILWNIEVSGKCALFVDMATPYDGPLPDERSDFGDMRDSFYLLMNLNQYRMKPIVSLTREAEGLLRIVLFSKDLKLVGSRKTLNQSRRKLAQDLRSNRRRGVVPVFVSTLWFLFALGISVESAFGMVGDNAQAHDLAVGLFMSWFPILILCSIVDRNPVASDDIRRKLNRLIDQVCDSLRDEETRNDFIMSFQNHPKAQEMQHWVEKITGQAEFIRGNYFTTFAGQGRIRFHYGAAHAILIDIEKSYIAEHGRDWLQDEREARISLVLGQVDGSLVWFDGRQLWQFCASIACVVGTASGSFIISYFTPTVGISCRSGGYMIFGIVAFTLLSSELLVWWYTSPIRGGKPRRVATHRPRAPSMADSLTETKRRISSASTAPPGRAYHYVEKSFVWMVTRIAAFSLRSRSSEDKTQLENAASYHLQTVWNMSGRQWTEILFFTPLECFNMIWLTYLVMAQAFGAFVNCACQASIWGPGGGYLDFNQWQYSNNPIVGQYWVKGTVISVSFMGLGIIYLVIEWCLQAHLSTENYDDAMRGLKNTRRFRRFTFWVRYPASLLVHAVNHIGSALHIRKTSQRKTLVWTRSSNRPTWV